MLRSNIGKTLSRCAKRLCALALQWLFIVISSRDSQRKDDLNCLLQSCIPVAEPGGRVHSRGHPSWVSERPLPPLVGLGRSGATLVMLLWHRTGCCQVRTFPRTDLGWLLDSVAHT